MVRIAMLSKWHVHAAGYAQVIMQTGLAEIAAVWDDDIARGTAWAEELGCPFYSDLDEVLGSKDIDAVVCDSPTTQHYEILSKAAKAGKHIFTEKALAPTVKESEELAALIENAGVTFTISYPHLTFPVSRFAKKLVEDGTFGQISLVRVRKAHNGISGGWLPDYWFEEKDAAGGALMDLGCHPMYMANWLLGTPKRITAVLTSPLGCKVDESATATIEYENGAVCTGETSFISYMTPETLEIYGTDATLLASDNEVRLYTKDTAGYVGRNYITPVLPPEMPIPLELFIQACVQGTGTPEGYGPRDGVALTRLLENAYISNKENRTVTL